MLQFTKDKRKFLHKKGNLQPYNLLFNFHLKIKAKNSPNNYWTTDISSLVLKRIPRNSPMKESDNSRVVQRAGRGNPLQGLRKITNCYAKKRKKTRMDQQRQTHNIYFNNQKLPTTEQRSGHASTQQSKKTRITKAG